MSRRRSFIRAVIVSGTTAAARSTTIESTKAIMLLSRILLTIATAAAVKAEMLFEVADEILTEGIKECKAKGLGEYKNEIERRHKQLVVTFSSRL